MSMTFVVKLTFCCAFVLAFCHVKIGQLEHDYESAGTGGNRFATILMYMSDLGPEDGGETVFPRAWPPGVPENKRVDEKVAIEQLRASPHGNVLEKGSWEEQLVGNFQLRLIFFK
jgi:hypothetical protein